MADKTSFILHLSNRPQWDLLDYEQKGRLIEAIYTYVETGEPIETDDGMLKMAFSVIAGQIDRDAEKYSRRCKINKQIADERERQKRERNSTNVHKRAEPETNQTDYDSEYDNDCDNDCDYESDIKAADKPPAHARSKQEFEPPTVSEVREYCEKRRNGIDPQRFVDYHAAVGWMQNGNPIRNWKAVVRKWESTGVSAKSKPPDHGSIDSADVEKLMNPYGGGVP